MHYSIVEYFSDHDGYKCGYCKKQNTAYSRGMWAHLLTVQDYESLINRGWRRSGKYCYKPTMKKTCCPQYEIRCDVTQIKLSKSQKKVMRKMKKYLLHGDEETAQKSGESSQNNGDAVVTSAEPEKKKTPPQSSASEAVKNEEVPDATTTATTVNLERPIDGDSSGRRTPSKGLGADPNRPQCVKAKVRRSEKKKAKLAEKGVETSASNKSVNSSSNQPLTLEDDLPHLKPVEGARHKLEVRLVQSNPMSLEFEESLDESYNLYKKYQMTVHNDSEDECTKRQWKRFLVDSPLQAERDGNGVSYGSFHNQYWLDGRLIAVGVVDILPTCISSVYVYYDIKFCSLSLGVYTALSEIALTRSYHALKKEMSFYCLGYYIETCSKMRYKGAYSPSFLLCPETYQWVNLEKCRETLQKVRYARLNVLDGGSIEDKCDDSFTEPVHDIELSRVLVLYKQRMCEYLTYRTQKAFDNDTSESEDTPSTRDELDEIRQYAALVGRTCAHRMLLYRA